MPSTEPDSAVLQPLLDRIMDFDPGVAADPPQSRPAAVRALKDAVRRDLEWLLNTRRTPLEFPAAYRELSRSVFAYGLPDLTSFTLRSQRDQTRLFEALEQTITTFEPRLTQVKVVSRDPFRRSERTLHFHIEALLLLDPAPESVSFDTVFKVDQGACEVKG